MHMDISNNNTDQPILSLNKTIVEYDLLLDSYINLPSDEIISSKKEILINVKHFIQDTFNDLILLKTTLGEKDIKFVDTINDVYNRVLDGVFLPYSEEVSTLNNSTKQPSVALNMRFIPYVKLLAKAVKNISNFDCQMNSKINSVYDVILINNRDLEKFKQRIKSVSLGKLFIDSLSSDDKPKFEISLFDLNRQRKSYKETNSSKSIDEKKGGRFRSFDFDVEELPYEDFIVKAIEEMK